MTRLSTGALFLIAALLLARFVAAQRTPPKEPRQKQWKEYVYPNDGFAITLPEKVDPHQDASLSSATFTAFTVTTTFAYTIQLPKDLGITLHVATFPKGCSEFFSQYQAAIRTAKRGGQADTPTLTESTAAGYPAVENEHETSSKTRYYDRIQCVENKLYVFTATWPGDAAKPPELLRVVNSFRVLTR